jgi:peptide/nickel transport system substrate-binding protein
MGRHLPRCAGMLLLAAGLAVSACQPRETARSTPAGEPRAGAPAAAPGRPEGKPGGTVTFAIAKDITLLNPLLRTNSTDQSVRELIFEALLDLDERGNSVPRLAERWEISPDGKVYTFHLRRGVKFHNGQDMTAEDAKFAIDYTLEPKNVAYGREALSLVERAEAADPHTLRIYLTEPSAAFLSILSSIQPFSVIPRGSLEEANEKPPTFPPGTGAFKFVEWQPKQRIVLERNDNYWGHKPYLERVVMRSIEDNTVRMTALRAGDVDLVERTPYEWVREIKDGKLQGIGSAEAVSAGSRHIVFNVAAPPFDNKKLRQAIAHGIDKRELLHAAYFGFGEPSDQKYPRGHTWYIDGVPAPTYDPDKARALLREAGYNGQEIPFIGRPASDETAAATTIQAQLKKFGVNVRLETLEYGAYTERQRKGEFAFMMAGTTVDPDPVPTYSRDLRTEQDLTKRGQNQAGYQNPQMDSLFLRAETELDTTKRRELMRQIVTMINDDVPNLPIGFVPRYFTFRDPVKGFTSDPEGRFMGLTNAWLDR